MDYAMRLALFRNWGLLVLFLLTACSAPIATPSPTIQAIPTTMPSVAATQAPVKATPVPLKLTPTSTPIPPTVTPDPTKYLSSELSKLLPGQYLVYWGSGSSFCGLKAISQTREKFKIANLNCSLNSDQEPVVSGNALFLLLADKNIQWLYHLADGQVEELAHSSRRDCMVYSVSWNGKWLAGRCGNPEGGFVLAVRSIDSDWTTLRALPLGIEERINFPTWSPDGKMVAFSNSAFGKSKGVYIIDASSCIESPPTCSTTLRGPYWKDSTDYIAWSPDGKQLAVTLSHTIFVYDVASKREKRLVDFTKEEYWLHGTAWSPDGKWIGYARDKEPNSSVPMDLYLVPPTGGSAIFLTDQDVVQVVAWLKIEP